MEQKLMKYALTIASAKGLKDKPHMIGRLGSQGGWHHATDARRALSWQPKASLPDGVYRLDQVGCPLDLSSPPYPQMARVNSCILGDTRKPIPSPNMQGIAIKSGILGIPLVAGKPLTIASPAEPGDEGYIYIDAAYLPPAWLMESGAVWAVAPEGKPERQPLTITADIGGIRISYALMPCAMESRADQAERNKK